MKPSLLIWDWNGTLLDDLDLCNRCLNDLLDAYGYAQRYDAAAYKEIFGFPIQDYYVRAGFDFTRHPYEALAEHYMEEYLPAAEGCGLCPGAHGALKWARDAGIRQVILSASQLPILRRQVEERSLSGFFDELLGQSDIYARGKKETGALLFKGKRHRPGQRGAGGRHPARLRGSKRHGHPLRALRRRPPEPGPAGDRRGAGDRHPERAARLPGRPVIANKKPSRPGWLFYCNMLQATNRNTARKCKRLPARMNRWNSSWKPQLGLRLGRFAMYITAPTE